MKEKLKFINVFREPVNGYKSLAKSVSIPGYYYGISQGQFNDAREEFGDPEDCDILLCEDPGLWLASLFDLKTLEDFEAAIVAYYGSPQNVVSVLEVGSHLTEKSLETKVIEAPPEQESTVLFDDTSLVENLVFEGSDDLSGLFESDDTSAMEDRFDFDMTPELRPPHAAKKQSVVQEIPVPPESVVTDMAEDTEDSPLTLDEFNEALAFLEETSDREVYSTFIDSVCKFAFDPEVSDKTMSFLYDAILDGFRQAILKDQDNALAFFDKIITKYLEESER